MQYSFIHIINSLDYKFGGPPVVTFNLALAQKKLGHSVYIVSTYISKEELKNVESNFATLKDKGIKIILFKSITFYRFSINFIKFLLSIKENSIFYFHGLYRFPTSIGALIARIKKYNYVIRVHGALDPYLFKKSLKGKNYYIFKKISEKIIDFPNLRCSMWVHLTSEKELKKLPTYLKEKCNLEIIPNGISVPENNNYLNLREKYSLSEGQKILLYLGRVNEKKGLDILIKSFILVNKKMKNVSLLIVGPDNENYLKELKIILKGVNSNIKRNVIFENQIQREYIKSYFKQANLYIIPSKSENFGMAIIESIYFGTPALISKNVDICEDLENNQLVNLISKLNPNDLAKDIIVSLNDDKLKYSVKNKGKGIISQIYSWTNIAKKINHLTNNYLNL